MQWFDKKRPEIRFTQTRASERSFNGLRNKETEERKEITGVAGLSRKKVTRHASNAFRGSG